MDEQVKRYVEDGTDAYLTQDSEGDWVRYSDYAALLAERDRLKKAVQGLMEATKWIYCNCGEYGCNRCDSVRNARASAVAALLEDKT